MSMQLVTLDFETFWDTDYSLSKMTPLEYVMDDRFEIISCSVKFDHHPTDVLFGSEVQRAFGKIDWSNKFVLGHNMSGFDAYIMAYRLGIVPRMWGCTMAMARPIHAKTTGLSLAKLVEHYASELRRMGISAVKNNQVLMQTKGRRLADFTPQEVAAMRTYNGDDDDQCYGLFQILRRFYTAAELWQIDAVIRMRTEPQFALNRPLLEVAASIERDRKHAALLELAKLLKIDRSDPTAAVETVRAELASAPKFAALLESRGVEVPMKPGKPNADGSEKLIPALAKTDEEFIALQEHEDVIVATAAGARLDVKSTLLETRIEKFLTAGRLAGGKLPVPIRYCGADTTGRDSGEEYNCFTGETEVLTPQGWVRLDQWDGAPIMQWWPDGHVSYEATPGRLVKPHDGPIVHVDSVLFSASMTPDHRLVSVRNGQTVERTAGWLAEHSGLDGVPTGGRWLGAESRFTPDEVRLLVAIAADGTVVPRKTQRPLVKIGLRRQRKVDRLHTLLKAVGVPYSVRKYPPQQGHTGAHPTTVFFLTDCPYEKGFGPWVLQLSSHALEALVDEAPHWDGWFHHSTGSTEFSTSDRGEAEWFATAVHLTGRATTIRKYRGRFQLHVRGSNRTSIQRADVSSARFSGNVYCASVESSYIMVRRNGKIAVAGQCQNLPRINPDKPKPSDALRNSLQAPPGHVVIVADQSGIELRVNHFLWQVPSSMALYQASPDKADLYRAFAAKYYAKSPDEISKPERQFGKVCQLGLGFGSGAVTFQRVARNMGGIKLTPALSESAVLGWRAEYPEIVGGWKACATGVLAIARGEESTIDPWGLVGTCEAGFELPSGRLIRYPNLREEPDGQWPDGRARTSWFYGDGRHKARITGPKADENVVQALARDSIFDCAIEFYRRTGLRPALRVHDELVYVVPESRASELLQELQAVLRTPPKWWPQLIVWSEGDIGPCYGAAK